MRILILCVLAFCGTLQAQDALDYLAAERSRIEDQAMDNLSWEQSKKLFIVKDGRHEQTLTPVNLEANSIGYVDSWQCKVVQIVDANSMIITTSYRESPVFWLSFKTDGLVDGDKIRLVGPVKVDGTEMYATVTGAKKTVRKLRFLTEQEAEQWKKENPTKPANEVSEWHKFTDGKKQFEGKVVSKTKTHVIIQSKDGRKLTYPINRLSDEDKAFLKAND